MRSTCQLRCLSIAATTRTLLIGLSGRGDKDMPTLSQLFGGARRILAEAGQ